MALYLLIGVVAFIAIGYIGFRVPAPIIPPNGNLESQADNSPLPGGLPELAYRFLSASNNKMESAQPPALSAWGRGYISSHLRFFGNFWLPVSWRLYLAPGEEFAIQNRITWYRRPFMLGGEMYHQGKGSYLLGSQEVSAPYLDDTERVLPWIYALWLSPASLVNLPGLEWHQTGNDGLTLKVKGENPSEMEFQLTVDPADGVLKKIQTVRKGSRSGDDYPFIVELRSPRHFDQMKPVPSKFVALWDKDIYLKLELSGICLNYDIQSVLQQGIEGLRT